MSNLNQFGARDVFEANLLRDTTAAAGWLLFVTIVAAIIEGLIIVSRFLNFGFINKFGTIVHIVVSILVLDQSMYHSYCYVYSRFLLSLLL